jgi:hypothetical protein
VAKFKDKKSERVQQQNGSTINVGAPRDEDKVRGAEAVEHKAVPMTSPGQQTAPAKADEEFEKLMEASRSAAGPDAFPPEPDRKTKLVRRVDEARVLAEKLGDKPTMDGLGDLAERIAREQLDEAGFEDMEKLLGEIQKGLEEAAGPGAVHVSFEDMPAEEQARLLEELRQAPPMPIISTDLPKMAAVTGAVEKLEQEAKKAAVADRIQSVSDEKVAVEHIRRIAVPGESLVQAVERLEAAAKRALETERLLEIERQHRNLDAQYAAATEDRIVERYEAEAEGLRALVGGDLKTRAVGVIVEDVEKERHVVHVFERGGGSLRVWAYNKGEKMPWHAARDVVEKLVDTRLTPEDKR